MSGSDRTTIPARSANKRDIIRRRIMRLPFVRADRLFPSVRLGVRLGVQLGEQIAEHLFHERDRGVDRRRDGVGEADALLDGRRLAPDDEDAFELPADPAPPSPASSDSTVDGAHAVRVHDRQPVRHPARAQGRSPHLDHGEVPGGSSIGTASTQHERVVPVEQLVREVHAADAEVLDPDVVRRRLGPRDHAVGDLDAEAVVAEEDVADARNEDARRHRIASASGRDSWSSGSSSSGAK